MPFSPAPFTPTPYTPPDFTLPHLAAAPDVTLVPAPKDFVAPEGYHAMSIYPEYLKIAGQWTLARDSRMDCVAVVEGGNVFVREFRHIRAGDLIACGRTENGEEGILVYTDGFRGLATSEDGAPHPGGHDNFAFRLGRSRETAFSRDYDELYELLRHDRDHGSIVWVMGPAFTFNGYSREAFAKIIDAGYADAVFAGNALATHDLEGAYFHTSLGQDIDTQENRPNGHYHHLDTINRVRYWGSIERFIEEEGVRDGIMNALVRNGVPYVLAGSIRDDGPLPGVYGNAYEAQDAMRDHIRSATTVICMATMLHTIATGNMTPSYRVLADVGKVIPDDDPLIDRVPEWQRDWRNAFQMMVDAGAVKECDTIEELEEALGLREDVLVQAVKDWNAACEAGEDTVPTYKYDPSWLIPISEPPYYGAKLGGNLFATKCGLRINPKMQVIDTEGAVIPGLYAGWHTAGGSNGENNLAGKPFNGLYGDVGLSFLGGYMAAGSIIGEI